MPRGWRAIRQRILERDPICKHCDQRESTQVHHKGHRDDHRASMLEGICDSCHRAETQRQAAAARHPGG
jgi:5-methylcytosine-specific restriction protein A